MEIWGGNCNTSIEFLGFSLCVSRQSSYNLVVKLLLEHEAQVMRPLIFLLQTPLHCACEYGHVEVVSTLLEHGADVKIGLDILQRVYVCICGLYMPVGSALRDSVNA